MDLAVTGAIPPGLDGLYLKMGANPIRPVTRGHDWFPARASGRARPSIGETPCVEAQEALYHTACPGSGPIVRPLLGTRRFYLFAFYWMCWTARSRAAGRLRRGRGADTSHPRATPPLGDGASCSGCAASSVWTMSRRGASTSPPLPCLIVANHQSAWEDVGLPRARPDVAIIAKRELLAIPVVGWFLRRSPMIVIDRANGTQALRTMIEGCQEAVAAGRSVLIFPEGRAGEMAESVLFKRGVELLYGKLGLTVVPVAVNSGLFWPGGATARPGTVVVSTSPHRAGLPSAEFLRGTEGAIDGSSIAGAELARSARKV